MDATFMAWNLLHLARLLADAGGIAAHGNLRSEWDDGQRFVRAEPGLPAMMASEETTCGGL